MNCRRAHVLPPKQVYQFRKFFCVAWFSLGNELLDRHQVGGAGLGVNFGSDGLKGRVLIGNGSRQCPYLEDSTIGDAMGDHADELRQQKVVQLDPLRVTQQPLDQVAPSFLFVLGLARSAIGSRSTIDPSVIYFNQVLF